ncbi:hypothetical protein F2P81_013183 [Scophthalmus maximus]|uniref:Uncharacterized protein n=1 Tax=Scophthalmus maximus TaxID=52904 RepID=A0A6A4SS61_SCOMX|nr:hypothetical protein F2P81_013183 [Scophthalmus maximus]
MYFTQLSGIRIVIVKITANGTLSSNHTSMFDKSTRFFIRCENLNRDITVTSYIRYGPSQSSSAAAAERARSSLQLQPILVRMLSAALALPILAFTSYSDPPFTAITFPRSLVEHLALHTLVCVLHDVYIFQRDTLVSHELPQQHVDYAVKCLKCGSVTAQLMMSACNLNHMLSHV